MNILNFEKGLENRRLEFVKSLLKEEGFEWDIIQTISEEKLLSLYAMYLAREKEKLEKDLDKLKEWWYT